MCGVCVWCVWCVCVCVGWGGVCVWGGGGGGGGGVGGLWLRQGGWEQPCCRRPANSAPAVAPASRRKPWRTFSGAHFSPLFSCQVDIVEVMAKFNVGRGEIQNLQVRPCCSLAALEVLAGRGACCSPAPATTPCCSYAARLARRTSTPNRPPLSPLALQEKAARFASMAAAFCERLGWYDLEALIAKFQVSFVQRVEWDWRWLRCAGACCGGKSSGKMACQRPLFAQWCHPA